MTKQQRAGYWLPLTMLKRLKAASKKTGMPMVEIIRRATDKALLEIESK